MRAQKSPSVVDSDIISQRIDRLKAVSVETFEEFNEEKKYDQLADHSKPLKKFKSFF